MEFATGISQKKTVSLAEMLDGDKIGTEVILDAMIHSIRDMGEIVFVILRRRDGLFQAVYEKTGAAQELLTLREGEAVRVKGFCKKKNVHPTGLKSTSLAQVCSQHPWSRFLWP